MLGSGFFFFEDKSKDRYTGLDSHTVQESIRQETTASRRIISRFSLAETNLSTLSTFRTMIFQLLAVTTFGPHAGNRDCRFQPHAYLLHSNTRCIFLPFFFSLTPLDLRIVPGREQPCLGIGGILSFEGKKRYILKSNSSKKVPHSKRLKRG